MDEAEYLVPKTIKIPLDLWEEIKMSGYSAQGKFSEFAREAIRERLAELAREQEQKQEPPKQ